MLPLPQARPSGPITVLNKTIFDTVANRPGGPNYLQFVGWVYFWGAILHWITAALNCTMHTTPKASHMH